MLIRRLLELPFLILRLHILMRLLHGDSRHYRGLFGDRFIRNQTREYRGGEYPFGRN